MRGLRRRGDDGACIVVVMDAGAFREDFCFPIKISCMMLAPAKRTVQNPKATCLGSEDSIFVPTITRTLRGTRKTFITEAIRLAGNTRLRKLPEHAKNPPTQTSKSKNEANTKGNGAVIVGEAEPVEA